MSKFIKRIFLFIILLFVILLSLDMTISHHLKRTESISETEVWNDLYHGKINCELAIYGSSRAWLHIDPKIINDSLNLTAYNFGIDAHNFWLQYLRHKEFLRNNPKPRVILHSLDVFTLQKREDLFNMQQFLPYMLWNRNILKYTSSYIGYSLSDYIVPLLRYSKAPLILYQPSSSGSKRDKGFKGMQRTWGYDFENAKRERENYVVIIDTKTYYLYKTFLNECKLDGIEVILVYTPEFIEGQNYVNNRNEIINTYRQLAGDYKLLFLDYSNNEICFDRKYFYNASHLNATGADIFTRILAHDLKVSGRLNLVD